MDFLFYLGQVACIIGLLYGAFLSVTHTDGGEKPSSKDCEYDPVTGHVWKTQRVTNGVGVIHSQGKETQTVVPGRAERGYWGRAA